MSKVAVLGHRDAVLGFKASGAVAFLADNAQEARHNLAEILRGDFAVLFVTEDIASVLQKELLPLNEEPKPVVAILPDARNSKGLGIQMLRDRVARAVGVNILLNGEE